MKSNSKRVYISCPISVPENVLNKFYNELYRITYIDPYYWERGTTYDPQMIVHADAVVFILPDTGFVANYFELPPGVRKELRYAYVNNKKIFLGYITRNGDYQFYEASVDENVSIRGIGGTYNEIYNFAKCRTHIPELPSFPVKSCELIIKLDRRLLLI